MAGNIELIIVALSFIFSAIAICLGADAYERCKSLDNRLKAFSKALIEQQSAINALLHKSSMDEVILEQDELRELIRRISNETLI